MIDLAGGGIFAAMFGDMSIEIRKVFKEFGAEIGFRDKQIFCSYSPHRSNYWLDRYILMLKELTGFESVALFSTGSEATEAFWRVCRVYTGKPGIWGGLVDPDDVGKDTAQCDAMHGMTLGALIMAGRMNYHELGYFAEMGEQRFGLGSGATGGMIMEPYHAPSAQFHKIEPTINRIIKLQKEFPDIPLCLDEIQGGFGRTGKLWAHEWYQEEKKITTQLVGGEREYPKETHKIKLPMLKPDFITIGKLCGGGLPLSALLGPKEIMESKAVLEHGHLHSTHSGNPLMCAVGCTVIEEMQKQKLIERSRILGEKMHEEIKNLPIRTHGKGLLAGFELDNNQEVKKVVDLCQRRNVSVCDTGRKWVKIGPQLNIEEEKLIEGIGILKEVIEEVVNERKSAPCGDSGKESQNGDSHILPGGIQSDREGDDKGSETSGFKGEYN